jgi:hypothetical protein
LSAVRILPEYERGVVFRLGRLRPTDYGPGLTEWRIAFENGWRGTFTGGSQDYLFIEAPFAKLDPVRDDPRFVGLLDDMRAELDR